MVENIIYQGGNRLFIAEDGLHLPKLPLTFLALETGFGYINE